MVQTLMKNSPVGATYTQAVDRESAYEILKGRATRTAPEKDKPAQREYTPREPAPRQSAPRSSNRQSVGEAMVKSVIRAAGSQVGRQITSMILRGVLGGISRR
jgi:hypothetical protein